MSLATDIQRAVKSGFTALGDVPESVTYQLAGEPTYNADTGVPTVPVASSQTVKVIFTNYRREEIDGEVIRPEDQKGLLAASGFVGTPTLNDTIAHGSETWTVLKVEQDPAKATWVLQLRRP